jgi:death-on-curing protein
MIVFDIETIENLHKIVVEYSGGSAGVREYGLLDSAINSIYQTFMGQELYPTIIEKGARLGYNLISNHAFVDGNKRIGILTMLTFLKVNGIELNYTDDDLIYLGLSTAKNSISYENLVDWLKNHVA